MNICHIYLSCPQTLLGHVLSQLCNLYLSSHSMGTFPISLDLNECVNTKLSTYILRYFHLNEIQKVICSSKKNDNIATVAGIFAVFISFVPRLNGDICYLKLLIFILSSNSMSTFEVKSKYSASLPSS